MYINSTNITPIMIMNRVYEIQNLLYIVPLMKFTIVIYISSVSQSYGYYGCFICGNIKLIIVLIDIRNIKVKSKRPD